MIRALVIVALVAMLSAPAWAQAPQPAMFPGDPLAEELAKALKSEAGMAAIRSAALAALQVQSAKREQDWAEYSKSLWRPPK